MTRVVVEAGICGFSAAIEVTRLSARKVRVVITSDCEMLGEMNSQLRELNWPDALKPSGDSPIYYTAFRCLSHAACPVPTAILKAIEVEIGAAVPGDVSIRFEKTKQS